MIRGRERGRRVRRRKRIGGAPGCQRGKYGRPTQICFRRAFAFAETCGTLAAVPLPMKLTINGQSVDVRAAADTPLLWVLRDELAMTGTKYGCGMGLCGACTIHLDGEATRACITPISAAAGKSITTIEGLAPNGKL